MESGDGRGRILREAGSYHLSKPMVLRKNGKCANEDPWNAGSNHNRQVEVPGARLACCGGLARADGSGRSGEDGRAHFAHSPAFLTGRATGFRPPLSGAGVRTSPPG